MTSIVPVVLRVPTIDALPLCETLNIVLVGDVLIVKGSDEVLAELMTNGDDDI